MNGVLKSWAIPKGPSMVPNEKRLAVMVEDHPFEYGKFYGEIASGNYGAGIVEIWDSGTYKPLTGDDDPEHSLLAMLERGDIKFSLNGTYLKGHFALFRLKSSEKENEWMLVKKADEFAEDAFEIESLPPLKSKKNQGHAKARRNITSDPFPDPIPEPMLARLVSKVADNSEWLFEIKLDGYRMICAIHNRKIKLVSRNANSYNTKFQVLLDDLGKIEEDVILDGEVVVENSNGRSEFQLLQNYLASGNGNLKYYVFDILYLSGHSVIKFPLIKRKELLSAFFGKYKFTRILNLGHQTGNGEVLFRRLSGEGYEGIISKDPDSIYVPGKRNDSWQKVKYSRSQEVIICGYTAPQRGRSYFGSIMMGFYDGDTLKYAGNCGTGFSEFLLKDLFALFEKLKIENCPFDKVPDLSFTKGKPTWLKPKLVAAIKFQEWTKDKIMRSPVFISLREDKEPHDVIYETGDFEELKTGAKTRKDKTVSLAGNTLKLTNLTKVFWPEAGYTKEDLISYYMMISRIILPYLKDRPQSLNRHPGGIKGESFFHKSMDVDLIPKWVKTIRMESGSHPEGINYLICNNVASLVYMVNLGCIEINPWHSIYKKPDYPDYMILDLDPGEVPFANVIEMALVIKELCDEISIKCFPKTSGASGLHVYIPLGAKYDYEQVKTFAEILAVLTHNRIPGISSLERPVSRRRDKVYIDFLQNRRGQTIAAPYCVRPQVSATVSTPLKWEEVKYGLSPEMFTIKNMEKRIGRVGDLWQPVLTERTSFTKALKAIEKLSK